MRILLLAIIICSFSSIFGQQNDPVLFRVDKDEIHVSEFKYIYEKNNAENADYSKESLEEYMELYEKFKLKVRRARDIGLDTVRSLQEELEGYRKQLAKSYLKDKEISNKLIDEVAIRMELDIEVHHIFVAAEEKSTDEKRSKAESKINDIYDKLKNVNGVGFEDMAKTLSDDKISATKGGRLGFYTSPLPDGFYEFENAMYETKIGEFSKPIRSKMGYHIIKPVSSRPARGEMEIAHILIRKKDYGAQQAKILIDSIYGLLQIDRNFENMAAKFSADTKSKSNGGYLGFFGINQYEETFEKAAFDIPSDEAYTMPVETQIGWHIIKRISKRDNTDVNRLKKRIKTRIDNNDRFEVAEIKMIDDVKAEGGFKEDKMALSRFATSLDETFYSYKWEMPKYEESVKLMELDGKQYNLNSFVEYIKSNVRERLKFNNTKDPKEAVKELYEKYVKENVMAYEEANLEKKHEDFKALMREYREGILLFEITKQEVWDKASLDTAGLKKFFKSQNNEYQWPERVRIYKYTITSDDSGAYIAYSFYQRKGHEKFIDKYVNDDKINVVYEVMTVDKDSELITGMELEVGKVSKLSVKPAPAEFYSFKELVPPSNKTLDEAKGYVIADYQDYLEKEWIVNLRKLYPIEVDQKVLESLVRK